MLKINNLKKSFGGIVATDNVNLELEKQTINAIIGPNGAGKTTLFNLITGKLKTDSGSIFIENREITNLDETETTHIGIASKNTVSSELSHGDQKLLDIALALCLKPKLLLLDEPTAGMGPEERWKMIDRIKELWKKTKITIVLVISRTERVYVWMVNSKNYSVVS